MMRFLPVFLLVFSVAHVQAQVNFTPVNAAFLDSQSYLNGVTWIDADNDNDLDVCVSGFSGAPPDWVNETEIFLNDGNGNFTPSGWITSSHKNGMRHGWADIDNDDDPDLYLAATWNQNDINQLWINNVGSFTLNQTSGATPNTAQPYEGTVSWADYNNDGWVDLFLPRWNNLKNRLFRNNGNGTFSEVTAGQLVNDLAWTSGGFWCDFDNDRDQDIFVVNYQIGPVNPGTNDLYRNNGNGTFTKMTGAGPIVTVPERGRSANWVDVNNDGRPDLFVCNEFGQDLLHINQGNGTFFTLPVGDAGHASWSSNWGDYDNDGDQDAITIGVWGMSRFWQNDGQGNLTDISASYPGIFQLLIGGSTSNGIVWTDANLDGWLDLHITQPFTAADHFFLNDGKPCGSWLEIKCTGIESNHSAIGTTIRAKATINGSPVWQMRQVSAQTASTANNPMWQHFGFGDAAFVDSLIVEWPSGETCVFTQVPVRQVLAISENCTTSVIKSLNNFSTSYQELTRCLPLDSLLLDASLPADGTWSANCGSCISSDGWLRTYDLTAGSYLAVYQQGSACDGRIDSFRVTLNNPPVVSVNAPDTLNYKETATLVAGGASNYSWEPSTGLSCSDCPSVELNTDSSSFFVVTGTDVNGCSDTVHVSIYMYPEPIVEMPNAFTPNNDGSNDEFKPAYKRNIFVDYKLIVYSRWGEIAFESYDIGEGWDGMHNGYPAMSDVYPYTFDYELVDGKKGRIVGQVTLIR
jgi:gliding motility-associated-like protein